MPTKPFAINGLDALKDKLKSLTHDLKDDIRQEMNASAQVIEREAKRNAPNNVGFLVNGISHYQSGDMEYTVVSAAIYSAYVEFGTRTQVSVPAGLEEFANQYRNQPNASSLGAKEAIYNWCKSKGIEPSAWYPIFISIMVKGIKPHPFFFNGFLNEKPKLIERIKKIVTDVK
jgi:HK97 gp10 family phage protein